MGLVRQAILGTQEILGTRAREKKAHKTHTEQTKKGAVCAAVRVSSNLSPKFLGQKISLLRGVRDRNGTLGIGPPALALVQLLPDAKDDAET